MKTTFFATTLSIFLTACSLTLPVKGQVQGTDEVFFGTATGYMDGSGKLAVDSSNGTFCDGSFIYLNSRQGEGVFNCRDGRTGPFTFVSTGKRGNGYGNLGGKNFTFSFGE